MKPGDLTKELAAALFKERVLPRVRVAKSGCWLLPSRGYGTVKVGRLDLQIIAAAVLSLAATSADADRVRASFYTDEFLADGKKYDASLLAAAHRDLPLGTVITVKHPASRRSAVLVINDRGPAKWTKRDLDFTTAAAKALRFPGSGYVVWEYWPPIPKVRPGDAK